MTFRKSIATAFFGGLVLIASNAAMAQQKEQAKQDLLTPRQKQLLQAIHWQDGPCEGKLGTVATVKVPAGYHFADAASARAYLELLGNPPDSDTVGVLEPSSDESHWLIQFSYENIGYVKDDEKDKIDADAILEAIKKGTQEANKKRAQMKAAPLDVIGWQTPPFYNSGTNRLSWAIRAQSEGQFIVNYNSRLLGRGGAMSANLIVDADSLDQTLPTYDQLLTGYKFIPGQNYSEFRSGDRVAEYGLAGLVAGGGFLLAAKSGLLLKVVKLVGVGLVVVGGVIAKFYRAIFGRKESAS